MYINALFIFQRTKALNREKKRTDSLLYQILPKFVAERLKNHEVIDAEVREGALNLNILLNYRLFVIRTYMSHFILIVINMNIKNE